MKPVEAYELIVRTGDFEKANFGPTEPPADLFEALQQFTLEDYNGSLVEAGLSLRRTFVKISTTEPQADNQDLIDCVREFDKIHSYTHGISILMQVWILRNLDPLPLTLAVVLEMNFAQLLKQLGQAKRLTRELAHQAIAKSDRADMVKSLTWTDDLTPDASAGFATS